MCRSTALHPEVEAMRHGDNRRSRPRPPLLRIAALAVMCFLAASVAQAEDVWTVSSGLVIVHFNTSLLKDLGIDLNVVGNPMPDQDDLLISDPRWGFPIRSGSDFKFKAEYGMALPGGSVGGSVYLDASIALRDHKSGNETRYTDLEITQAPWPGSDATAGEDGPPIVLRSHSSGLVICQLVSSMFDFREKTAELRVHYLNARLTSEWAQAIGRPELAGWVVGQVEIRGHANMISSVPPRQARYEPVFEGGLKDVSLGALSSVQQSGHIGANIPDGTTGLSMSTTSCNLGQVDVPWLSPMQTDHPTIHMALYRLMNGRFEQVGISWLKHGFFALSNNQCTACQHPSDGSFLGVGCSDTYGVSNNSDRNYLGPREEVNPYTGIWTCTGSHFSGGVADCSRRHGSSGHDAVQHKLIVQDADLNNAGATYYYEAYYIVRGDQVLHNNWGSRRCTMTGSGTTWTFTTPSTSNSLVEGPALERWGDLRTTQAVGPNDGEVLLAVTVTDNGNGTWHYEYALLNKNSNREVRSFAIPVEGVNNITNMGFHDNDTDASNDWKVSVGGNVIQWSTSTFDIDPDAEALEFGYMANFRFDADSPPSDLNASLSLFKPGPDPSDFSVATRGPTNTVVAVEGAGAGMPRLIGIRPNPANRRTTISYELSAPGAVKLEIYDAAGRLVRTLIDESRSAGQQSVVWDGKNASGSRVAAGVYHARLHTANLTVARPVVMVK
jgi:hypothetical protein